MTKIKGTIYKHGDIEEAIDLLASILNDLDCAIYAFEGAYPELQKAYDIVDGILERYNN